MTNGRPKFQILCRVARPDRISRIYSDDWDNNLGAWTEEAAELIAAINESQGDDEHFKLVGEARWVWLRIGSTGRCEIQPEQFKGAREVTMMRVHIIRRKKARPIARAPEPKG